MSDGYISPVPISYFNRFYYILEERERTNITSNFISSCFLAILLKLLSWWPRKKISAASLLYFSLLKLKNQLLLASVFNSFSCILPHAPHAPDVFLSLLVFCFVFHYQMLTSFQFLSSARSSFFGRYFLFLNFCLFWCFVFFNSCPFRFRTLFPSPGTSFGGLRFGLSSNIVFPFPLLSFLINASRIWSFYFLPAL